MAKKRGRQKESLLKKAIKDYLHLHGFCVYGIVNSGFYIAKNDRGIADLWLGIKGQTIWIELKVDKGKQSENQIRFQQAVEKEGFRYEIVRSLDDVVKLLEELTKEV